jgi:dipeptidase D
MSRYEQAVLKHIISIAEEHHLQHTSDAYGNIAVFRPGSGGAEESGPIIVQAHVDMVCEKHARTQVCLAGVECLILAPVQRHVP